MNTSLMAAFSAFALLAFALALPPSMGITSEQERQYLFDRLLKQHLGLTTHQASSKAIKVPDFVMEQVRAVRESQSTNFHRPGLLAGSANVLRTVRGEKKADESERGVTLTFDIGSLMAATTNEAVTAVELKVRWTLKLLDQTIFPLHLIEDTSMPKW